MPALTLRTTSLLGLHLMDSLHGSEVRRMPNTLPWSDTFFPIWIPTTTLTYPIQLLISTFITALLKLMFSNMVRVPGPHSVEVEPGLQDLRQVLLDFREGLVLLHTLAQRFCDGDGHHLHQDSRSHVILHLSIEVLLQTLGVSSPFPTTAAASLSFLTFAIELESQKIEQTVLSPTVAELYSFMKCFGSCQFLRGSWMDMSAGCRYSHEE